MELDERQGLARVEDQSRCAESQGVARPRARAFGVASRGPQVPGLTTRERSLERSVPGQRRVNIELLSLDRSEVVFVNDRVLGYRGRFRWYATEGSALIVPYSGREDDLVPGARLSVETSHESVSAFEIVSPRRAPGLSQLARAGDYAVTGTVDFLVGEVIEIDVEDLHVAVDLEESGGVVPDAGDGVAFLLHGLSLWCTNIW